MTIPDLTSRQPDAHMCGAPQPGRLYVCTRRAGHTGRHAAGDGSRIVSVWGDSFPTMSYPFTPDGAHTWQVTVSSRGYTLATDPTEEYDWVEFYHSPDTAGIEAILAAVPNRATAIACLREACHAWENPEAMAW